MNVFFPPFLNVFHVLTTIGLHVPPQWENSRTTWLHGIVNVKIRWGRECTRRWLLFVHKARECKRSTMKRNQVYPLDFGIIFLFIGLPQKIGGDIHSEIIGKGRIFTIFSFLLVFFEVWCWILRAISWIGFKLICILYLHLSFLFCFA